MFFQELIRWSRNTQSQQITKVKSTTKIKKVKDVDGNEKDVDYLELKDFVLIGGSYSDTPTDEIMQNFLEVDIDNNDSTYYVEDARVSEELLKPKNFMIELLRLGQVADVDIIRNMDSKTEEKDDNIVHTLRYYPERIDSINKKIVNQTKKEAGLLSKLAQKAINNSIKANFDATKLLYNVRYPTYDGLNNNIKFVIELTIILPKDGDFSNQDIERVLETAHLIKFLVTPKEKFLKEFEKFLQEETNKYFVVKEHQARMRNYYLRG
jgi:hypothetical protein